MKDRSETRSQIMIRLIATALFLALLAPIPALGDDAESARKELKNRNIPYTAKEFVQRAIHGDNETIKLFLRSGMDPDTRADISGADSRSEYWATPLLVAASWGRTDTVGLLLDFHASPEATGGDYNSTALAEAARRGQTDTLKLLLERGAEGGNYSSTALAEAARGGHTDTVKALLERGAEGGVAAMDMGGQKALKYGLSGGHTEVIELLLDKGADLDVKISGSSPLRYAATRGYVKTAELLIERGADVNAKNHEGRTALLEAALWKHVDVVSLLIENGADVNARTKYGQTALGFAKRSDETYRLLKQAGATE